MDPRREAAGPPAEQGARRLHLARVDLLSGPPASSDMTHRVSALAFLSALAVAAACASAPDEPQADGSALVAAPLPPFTGTAYEAAAGVHLPAVPPEDHPSLHNIFELSDGIISGSEPHDEEAFRILREKGIRTILSVDGKVPDAATAERYGMKYVHVPIQYKGISDEEIARIAKTFREQEGPFYVHCFHGKHRGPAAAEIGRLVLDGISRETAIAEMRQWCGTAQSYEGLYDTVAHAEIPSASRTRALEWSFPASSPLEGIGGSMVEVSRADDNVKALSKNGWKADAHHPDLDPLNEVTKLAGLFERSLSLEEVRTQPEDFRRWMADARDESAALRDAVAALASGGSPAAADAAYKTLSKTCSACHDVYRN